MQIIERGVIGNIGLPRMELRDKILPNCLLILTASSIGKRYLQKYLSSFGFFEIGFLGIRLGAQLILKAVGCLINGCKLHYNVIDAS